MKFRHSSSIRISLLLLFAFPAFSNVHADPYDVQALTAHLRQKLGNIQQEYEGLRDKKKLRYLWNEPKQRSNNLDLSFFKCYDVRGEMAVKDRMESLLSFEEPNLKGRLKKFISVFASEDFLRMLFGNESVDNLITYDGEDGVFVWWDKEPSENPSKELLFSLRVKHTYHEDPKVVFKPSDWLTEGRTLTALDMSLVFAYDSRTDAVRFVGLKDKLIVNVEFVENTDFPICPVSNLKSSVQQDN